MALLYRAIWSDDRPDLIDAGPAAFNDWVRGKRLGLEVPDEGVVEADGSDVTVARVEDGSTCALRIRLNEERPVDAGAERWTTTAHWMTDGTRGWVWVDLEWVSDAVFAPQPDVAAPKLVGVLLGARSDGAGPRLGPKPLAVRASDTDELVEWLYDDERAVPVVVFSVDTGISPEDYSRRVQEVARRLTGCADVRMLTADSERLFDQAMRDASLSVFGGAARVYLPGIHPANPMPWRHRWVRANLLTNRHKTAAARIAQLVLPRMVAQRPPALYRTHVKQLMDQSVGEQTDWEVLAVELDEALSLLQLEIEDLREEKDLALMEALESERDAADALAKLEAHRRQLRIRGEVPELVEQEVDEAADVDSCAQAVALAAGLKHLVVHPDAPRDISRMDESPNSELWGQRIWAHLQSLDAYAEARGPGFQIWCENAGHPRAIASKFISMTESETVCNNERLRRCRDLPVDTRIDVSGEIEMMAHIKSIQGGGMQIPRIYFHDDTKGKTGKVHVGFIGPHDLVPNTLSN